MAITDVFTIMISYWIISISMVYLNKTLLSLNEASQFISAPLFMTWFQCIVTCCVCVILGKLTTRSPSTCHQRKDSFFSSFSFPMVTYHLRSSLVVLPLSTVFVSMIALNNICLQYVTVSFYNVARSLTILFNVVFTYIILGIKTNAAVCITLLVVIVGFFLGIDGEVHFSLFGTITGVLSSIFNALNSILTTQCLKRMEAVGGTKANDDQSPLHHHHPQEKKDAELLFYNHFNAIFLFPPFILFFERQVILANVDRLMSPVFWIGMLLVGIMGFAIGLITVMQVRATTPLTHTVSATAKAATQSLLAVYIWQTPVTLRGVLGVALVLLGSGLYCVVQSQQQQQEGGENRFGRISSSSSSNTGSSCSINNDNNFGYVKSSKTSSSPVFQRRVSDDDDRMSNSKFYTKKKKKIGKSKIKTN